MRPGTLLPIDILGVGGQQISPLKIVISHKPCPDFLSYFAVHSLYFTVACGHIWTCLEKLYTVFIAPPFENHRLKFVVGLDDVRVRITVFAAYLLKMVYNCRHLLVRHRFCKYFPREMVHDRQTPFGVSVPGRVVNSPLRALLYPFGHIGGNVWA